MKIKFSQPKLSHYFMAMMVFIIPIVLANFYYIDDNYRAITGDDAWDIDGRPLSNLVMYVVNLNYHLADIFPIPTILSALLLAFCMYIYGERFTDGNDNIFIRIIVPLGVMASPFFIENSSYRFDILPMYFSMALSYVFIFLKGDGRLLRISVFSVCVASILSTYQASINFTLSIILCEVARRFISEEANKKTINYITDGFLSLVVGSIFYFKVILPVFLTAPQTADHPGIDLSKLSHVFIDNTKYYLTSIYQSVPDGIVFYCWSIILCMSVFGVLYFSIKRMRRDKCLSTLTLSLIVLISPFASILFSFISLSLLDGKLIAPRVMIGFSGTCLFLFTLTYYVSKISSKYFIIILFIPLLYVVGLYSAYSNSMRSDSNFTELLMNEIKEDSFSLSKSTEPMLYFYGERPLNKEFENSYKNYPIITKVVQNYFYNWTVPYTYMSRIGINIKQPVGVSPAEVMAVKEFCQSHKLNSYYYNMIYKDKIIFVDFTKSLCNS